MLDEGLWIALLLALSPQQTHDHFIGESRPGSIFINAGYRDLDSAGLSARMRELSDLQFRVLTPWSSVRSTSL